MSIDLVLKQSCGGCGTAEELYGTTCKHLTLCVSCGKTMAGTSCSECGTPITRLIREVILVKEENSSNGSSPSPVQATGPVTEDEIRAMLSSKARVTTRGLVFKFKSRLTTREDKAAFAEILKKICKIRAVKRKKIIFLRENAVTGQSGPVTEDEIRAMIPPKTQVLTQDLVAKFKSRLNSKEDKAAFAEILKKISKKRTVNGKTVVFLADTKRPV